MDPKIGTQIGRNWKDSFKDKEGPHHLLRNSLQGKHCYNLKPVCIKLAQPWLVTFPGQLFFSGKKAQPGPTSVRAFLKMQARCIYVCSIHLAQGLWVSQVKRNKFHLKFYTFWSNPKSDLRWGSYPKKEGARKMTNWFKRFADNIGMEEDT